LHLYPNETILRVIWGKAATKHMINETPMACYPVLGHFCFAALEREDPCMNILSYCDDTIMHGTDHALTCARLFCSSILYWLAFV